MSGPYPCTCGAMFLAERCCFPPVGGVEMEGWSDDRADVWSVTGDVLRVEPREVAPGPAVAERGELEGLPAVARANDLGHDGRGVVALDGQVGLGELHGSVEDAELRVVDLLEVGALVGAEGADERPNLLRELVQEDVDDLVVALAPAGTVVARVGDRAAEGSQVVVVGHADGGAGLVERDDRGVEVDTLHPVEPRRQALRAAAGDVPAEAEGDPADGDTLRVDEPGGVGSVEALTHVDGLLRHCCRSNLSHVVRGRLCLVQ